jgi:hypothetical protein
MVDKLNQSQIQSKQALREALKAYGGNPQHEAVAAAINRLIEQNPTSAPARQTTLLEGDWLLTSAPSFPNGELQPDGSYVYTLGRLAFNMFEPRDLKVVINQVSQPVFPIQRTGQYTHDIVVKFTVLDETVSSLQGIVRNLGVCEPGSDTALQVQFTGGVLEPAAGTDLAAWNAIFGTPGSAHRPSLKDWTQSLFLKLMFGLVPPTGMNPQTGRSEFSMKRSPNGSLGILYLDEDLRITKGEKGTVLVCEKR